jgi:hypothetical protein
MVDSKGNVFKPLIMQLLKPRVSPELCYSLCRTSAFSGVEGSAVAQECSLDLHTPPALFIFEKVA